MYTSAIQAKQRRVMTRSTVWHPTSELKQRIDMRKYRYESTMQKLQRITVLIYCFLCANGASTATPRILLLAIRTINLTMYQLHMENLQSGPELTRSCFTNGAP